MTPQFIVDFIDKHGFAATGAVVAVFFLWRCAKERTELVKRLMDLVRNNTAVIKARNDKED